MAYPIRFKLVKKDTGEVIHGVKGADTDGVVSAVLLPDGTPAIWSQSYYEYVNVVSCADYDLFVAIEKVDGQWVYKQVGF